MNTNQSEFDLKEKELKLILEKLSNENISNEFNEEESFRFLKNESAELFDELNNHILDEIKKLEENLI